MLTNSTQGVPYPVMADESLEADRALLAQLGVSKLARELGYSIQRVQNWTARGIPADEKLKRPDLFLPQFKTKRTRSPA